MNSDSRRIKSSQRTNIAFKEGSPSKSTITEGEELMSMRKNKGLSFFRRQKGILWWMNFTKDGNSIVEKNLKVERSVEIGKNLTVKGNLTGQRAYFDAGESTPFTSSKYLSYNDGTLMVSTNGYIMMRPGSITGMSICFNAVNLQNANTGTMSVTVQARINGSSTLSTTNGINANSVGLKNSVVQARGEDEFAINDVLTMYVSIVKQGQISADIDNMNAVVEVTYDS